jgi:hypothetical protein
MSYSISKINYYINKVSFGNNQTTRNNTDFGIYIPSTEDTSNLPLSEILVGPQVVFAEPSVTVTVGPVTSNQSGAPTGSPLNGPSSVLEQQNILNNNNAGGPMGSPLNAPSILNNNINNTVLPRNVVGNILPQETVESNVANIFSSVRTNRAREAVRNAQQAAERASTNNFGRGNRR